jgi:hypothetical protein
MPAGLRALAVVALLAAARSTEASPPLILGSIQTSISILGLDFLTRGWTFTHDGRDLHVSTTVGLSSPVLVTPLPSPSRSWHRCSPTP